MALNTTNPPKPGFDPYVYPPRNFIDAWRMQKLLAVQTYGIDVKAEEFSASKEDPRVLPITAFATAIRLGTWWAKTMEQVNLDEKNIVFDPRKSLAKVLAAIKHSAEGAGLVLAGVINFAEASKSKKQLTPEDTYTVWHELEDLAARMNAVRQASTKWDTEKNLVYDAVASSIEELPDRIRGAVKTVAGAGGEVVIWASRTMGEAIVEITKPAFQAISKGGSTLGTIVLGVVGTVTLVVVATRK